MNTRKQYTFFYALLVIWIELASLSMAQMPSRISFNDNDEKPKIKTTSKWQFGAFVQGGFPPDYYESSAGNSIRSYPILHLYSAGFEAGRVMEDPVGRGVFRGKGEVLLEVMPFWLARFPAQNLRVDLIGPVNSITLHYNVTSENIFGSSVTPLLMRWNFCPKNTSRVIPWAQLGGGLLWTSHQFPLGYQGPTSVINFTPQGGVGVNIFTRPKKSVELGVKVIHISNAGLGTRNPGINQSVHFSAGYNWWK